jgi:thioredoxin-like negative regulator of GroEL
VKPWTATLATLSLAAAVACTATPPALAAPGLPSTNVAWLAAAADTDVERAFALARSEKKPVLLYWGATWCPPCNQLKATLFNRQDFAELSRHFVAVHVDGDRPGAQKLGSRFKVSGYPTVVLFGADGQEITRLPGEADAPQLMAVLQAGLAAGRPVKALLDDALKGRVLAANEWRSLAFYSWETDEQQLVPKADLPGTLARLAAASPAADAATGDRLWLKALAASDDGKGVKPDAALRERVLRVLADPARARALMDVVSSGADDITKTLDAEGTPGRTQVLAAFETALRRFESDVTLSRNDRLAALYARVLLARLDQPKEAVHVTLPEPLLKEVREHVARADREITDGYERQAVITFAAALLGRAGLWADSDTLLKANLARSHSPYYLMSQLGSNARRLGRTDEALNWFAQSFDKSEGPATRLQWGAGYLAALVDLAPQDAMRIEKTAGQLLAEAARDSGAFEGRSVRSLQRMSGKLLTWSGDKAPQRNVLQRLQAQLDGICPKVELADGQRAACQALLKAPAKKTS